MVDNIFGIKVERRFRKYHLILSKMFRGGALERAEKKGSRIIRSKKSVKKTTISSCVLETKKYRLRDRCNPGVASVDLDIEDSADEASPEAEAERAEEKSRLGQCTRRPAILIFDSLLHSKKPAVIATLKQYLQSEWSAKNQGTLDVMKTIEGHSVQVPLQSNNFDCGIFLLQYVEQFFREPITDFSFPINLSQWFTRRIIDLKRNHIKNILFDLDRRQVKTFY
jgi:Ulp1 family protease